MTDLDQMPRPRVPAAEERVTPDDLEPPELRAAEDGSLHFTGYAAVFDSPSVPMPFVETFRAGAFVRSLGGGRPIPLLINHDRARIPLAVAPQTMRLGEDSRGLLVDADLAPTSDAHDLRAHFEAGNVRHMSFAFKPTPKGEAWSDDGKRRDVTEARLFEVSVLVGHPPAYAKTTAYMRSLAQRVDVEPDELTLAVDALAEGRRLTDEEVRLLEAAIDDLHEASTRAVPLSLRQRRLDLARIRPA